MTISGALSSIPADPIAVVCHDAGAANHIFAWIRKGIVKGKEPLRIYLEGPAKHIWQNLFPNVNEYHIADSLDDALLDARSLIVGSGWGSNLEYNALEIALRRGIPSAGVVDHWVNYLERFKRNGVSHLPSEIWVTDPYACLIATKKFPQRPIRQIENVYLENLVFEIKIEQQKINYGTKPTILYALEPARSNWGRNDKNGEFQGLDYFISNIEHLGLGQNPQLLLRPHPSDEPGKYDAWIATHQFTHICLDPKQSLAQAIAIADCVVGLNSYALVIALAAGKKVFSTIPPWGPACVLPHPEIIHLRDIVGNADR